MTDLHPDESELVVVVPPVHGSGEPVPRPHVARVVGERRVLTDLIDDVGR